MPSLSSVYGSNPNRIQTPVSAVNDQFIVGNAISFAEMAGPPSASPSDLQSAVDGLVRDTPNHLDRSPATAGGDLWRRTAHHHHRWHQRHSHHRAPAPTCSTSLVCGDSPAQDMFPPIVNPSPSHSVMTSLPFAGRCHRLPYIGVQVWGHPDPNLPRPSCHHTSSRQISFVDDGFPVGDTSNHRSVVADLDWLKI